MSRKKVLLISGYDAASHRYWREILQKQLDEYDWTQVALPARNFSWRMRGSVLNLLVGYEDELSKDYDLLIVTSMVDLAALRGLVPQLCQIPTILYFHENQFVYPISREQPNILNAQLTSLYSALAADAVWFNSAYNQQSFAQGAKKLLKKVPDKLPLELSQKVLQKSRVLPVPIKQPSSLRQVKLGTFEKPMHIVWNHRWEYDKQPEVLFEALKCLLKQNVRFKLSVVGESFREVPSCFQQAKNDFADHIDRWGFLPKNDYIRTLIDADIVVSTALHDFQGLSIMEAMSYSCIPVVPDRLVYPEYVCDELRYNAGATITEESHHLANKLFQISQSSETDLASYPIDIKEYFVEPVIQKYRSAMVLLSE